MFYTRYFFSKYYDRYAERAGVQTPQWLALLSFCGFAIYSDTLRPPLYAMAMWLLRRRQRALPRPAPL